MRQRQGSVLETLRRVQRFLDTNAALLGAINASGSRKALDDSIAQLTTHAVDQSAGLVASKGETGRQKVLRATLRQAYMKPIATIARAKLRDVPEFRSLQLPADQLSTPRLLAAAGAMKEAAAKHEQVFVDGGLPQDFVAQLQTASDNVAGSVDGRAASRGRRVGATKGLRAEEKRGRDVVRVLDSLVVPALGTNDALVAEWKSLKRVSLKPGGSSTTGSTSTAPSTSPSSGTPAQSPAAVSPAPAAASAA